MHLQLVQPLGHRYGLGYVLLVWKAASAPDIPKWDQKGSQGYFTQRGQQEAIPNQLRIDWLMASQHTSAMPRWTATASFL